jgi:hypothetical protein|tara:strand:+ start:319 stop:507 length:189 start_codon:yes stop_codon:yes gene_type:complete
MNYLEIILVGLIVFGAAFYLYQTFFPKKKGGSSCGCGTSECKVPKVTIDMIKKTPFSQQGQK